QSKALQLQMQQLEAKNLPEAQRLELQKLRKQIAEIGKVQPVSDYDREMQEVKLATAKAELAKLEGGSGGTPNYRGMTASQILDTIRGNYSIDVLDEHGYATG